MSSITVRFQNQENSLQLKTGETLLHALRQAGYSLPAACGGKGRCGKCRVSVNGVSRLACKTVAHSGDVVLLPEHSGGKILTETLPVLLEKVQRQEGCVAAFDIGTTTIALRLYDYADGRELCTLTEWNQQASYGGDVVSRMEYILAEEKHLQELASLVRSQCENMLQVALKICGREAGQLLKSVVAGNTIMQHIFAGLPIDGIAVAPFVPYTLFTDKREDCLLGAPLYYAPCVSGYVGGDITAGLLASGLAQKVGETLFLDIGTNGEMALGGKDGFLCCAVASGPAFEGAGITCGMPAVDGAISHVCYDNGFLYDSIGSEKPKGICGSGLVDLVAELLRLGCIDEGGRLLPPGLVPAELRKYIKEDDEGNGCFYLNNSIYLTARDVRNLQLAKGAVAGGIAVLLAQRGITLEQLSGVVLAGGFGAYINAANAVNIGLLPKLEREKYHVIGNSALAGASLLALNPSACEKITSLAQEMKYIELSGRTDFANAFADHLGF